jgi:hypothetical protein
VKATANNGADLVKSSGHSRVHARTLLGLQPLKQRPLMSAGDGVFLRKAARRRSAMSQNRGGSPEATSLVRGVMEVRRRLLGSPYWSLRQLDCDVEQGYVVVRGVVPSYYLKQVAQAVATQAVEKERLVSEITVREEVSCRERDAAW